MRCHFPGCQGVRVNTPTPRDPVTLVSPSSRCSRAYGSILRQDLSLREADEPFLIGSHLVDVDVVDPGLRVLVDFGKVLAGIRSDDNALGDLLWRDKLNCLLEVGRRGQLLA